MYCLPPCPVPGHKVHVLARISRTENLFRRKAHLELEVGVAELKLQDLAWITEVDREFFIFPRSLVAGNVRAVPGDIEGLPWNIADLRSIDRVV
jgi:hypothetical protein